MAKQRHPAQAQTSSLMHPPLLVKLLKLLQVPLQLSQRARNA